MCSIINNFACLHQYIQASFNHTNKKDIKAVVKKAMNKLIPPFLTLASANTLSVSKSFSAVAGRLLTDACILERNGKLIL